MQARGGRLLRLALPARGARFIAARARFVAINCRLFATHLQPRRCRRRIRRFALTGPVPACP
jgi:hypothetical protein